MAKPPKAGDQTPAERRGGARGGGARDVGSLLPAVGGVAFKRFGFSQAQLLGRWREVVGPVYARWSIPESLRFPQGKKSGGTLTIRVEGPFSTQLQHVTPQIIERVNRIFGYAAVERVRLLQGEVPRPAARPQPPQGVGPDGPGASPNLSGVKDQQLREALEQLARQLGASSGPPKIG